ncbi:hypothetical protein CEY12_21085 [Chryseobacterium sp. T16E-39]|uniref:hypothetical protein n=1 Tax=Chryseobacterium sp. T16E-39 TaxID=2015076 RepID=UPI000B5B2DDC|nr:hypothetical protein [Chryseobacterium sp. T16E-39]ASK32425.1 hypothetical protein CEY12_21085 [Chryseobacterium sp. T16E-39]
MLRKIIHLLFLPCSTATLLMEKKNAGSISPKEDRKLSMHLRICKWCRAYQKKLELLDDIMKRTFTPKENDKINDADIQEFKEGLIKKIDF